MVAHSEERNEATYVSAVADADGNFKMEQHTEPFDLMHVTPRRGGLCADASIVD